MGEILISAKVWELKDGIITKISINDVIFKIERLEENIIKKPEPVEQVETKRCIQCGEVKPLSEFYRRKDSKDGFNNRCKKCLDEYQKLHKQGLIPKRTKPKASANYGGISILPEVADRIREALSSRKNANLRSIIKEYYPNVSRKSVKKYEWAYKRYLKESEPEKFGDVIGDKANRKKDYTGKILGYVGHTPIIDTVLEEFKEAVSKNRSVKKVMRNFFPTYKTSTHRSLVTTYKRWVREQEGKELDIKPKKSERHLPEDTVGYCETYQTLIKKDEYDDVLRVINIVEYDYQPTAEAIRNRSTIPKHRVAATLRYLQDENIVKYRINEFGKPVYFTVNKKETNPVLEVMDYGNFTLEEISKRVGWDNKKTREALVDLKNKNKIEIVFDDTGHIVYKKIKRNRIIKEDQKKTGD